MGVERAERAGPVLSQPSASRPNNGGFATANTYCPSSICIEVDELNFFQIAKNIFKNLNFEQNSSTLDLDNQSSCSESSLENMQYLKGQKQEAQSFESILSDPDFLYNHLIFREFLDAQGMESIGFREFCCLILIVAS